MPESKNPEPVIYPEHVGRFVRDPQQFVKDGDVLYVERARRRLILDPRSNEEWEIIQVRALPKEEN